MHSKALVLQVRTILPLAVMCSLVVELNYVTHLIFCWVEEQHRLCPYVSAARLQLIRFLNKCRSDVCVKVIFLLSPCLPDIHREDLGLCAEKDTIRYHPTMISGHSFIHDQVSRRHSRLNTTRMRLRTEWLNWLAICKWDSKYSIHPLKSFLPPAPALREPSPPRVALFFLFRSRGTRRAPFLVVGFPLLCSQCA